MNSQTTSKFPTIDTVMTALTVGGLAVACAMVIVMSGVRSIIA